MKINDLGFIVLTVSENLPRIGTFVVEHRYIKFAQKWNIVSSMKMEVGTQSGLYDCDDAIASFKPNFSP